MTMCVCVCCSGAAFDVAFNTIRVENEERNDLNICKAACATWNMTPNHHQFI